MSNRNYSPQRNMRNTVPAMKSRWTWEERILALIACSLALGLIAWSVSVMWKEWM